MNRTLDLASRRLTVVKRRFWDSRFGQWTRFCTTLALLVGLWLGMGFVAFGAFNARSCGDLKARLAKYPILYKGEPGKLEADIREDYIHSRAAIVFGPVSLLISSAVSGFFVEGLKFDQCQCSATPEQEERTSKNQ